MDHARDDFDDAMMRRVFALAREGRRGELPFACVICSGDRVIAEATNEARAAKDVTRHAEIVALAQARRAVARSHLVDCTLYTNVEPCAMCSFAIRETRLRRVVYGLRSPLMGGHTKWGILTDPDLSRAMPEVFGPPPVVCADRLAGEAERAWSAWNPLIWNIIKLRGCFAARHGSNESAPADEADRSWDRSRVARAVRSFFTGI